MALEMPPYWDDPPPAGEGDYGVDTGPVPQPTGTLKATTQDQKAPKSPRAVRWLTPAECSESDARGYIIKGLIAPHDLMLIFGGPGLGKSCIAPRLAYAIAQGGEVFGRRVKQGRVLYVAAEDGHGMRARITALMTELGDTDALLMAEGLGGFMEVDDTAETALRAKVAEMRPSVVIIDTIAAGFAGLKENDSGAEGMGRVVDFARGLIADFAVAVILIHHVPKGDPSTPRGHGLLHGDADVALALSRDDAGLIRANFTKNRNGPSDGVLAFTIRAVTLGTDDDGDPITAPVCDPADGAATSGKKLSQTERNALRCLYDLIAAEGTPLPVGSGFPSAPIQGAKMDRWQAEYLAHHLSGAKDDTNRKRGFRDVRGRLRDKGMIAIGDGWVWPIHTDQSQPGGNEGGGTRNTL